MHQKFEIKKSLFAFLFPLLFSASLLVAKEPTPAYITYYNEGLVAQRNNDYEDAIDRYNEALNLKPDFPDALNNLGFCYRMTAMTYLTQSGDAYEKALKYDPMHDGALEYQGEYFLMLGELDKAYENYLALKKMKSPDAKELKASMDKVLKQASAILKVYSP